MLLFWTHAIAALLSGAAALLVAYWVHTRGTGRPSTLFALLLVCVGLMPLIQGLQLLSPPSATWPLFYARQAVGLAIGPLWLVFALDYTDRQELLTRHLLAGVTLVLTVQIAVLVTDPFHHALYPDLAVVAEPFRYVVLDTSAVYWAQVAVNYVLVAVGFGLVFRLFLRSRYVSRKQPAVLLLAASIPVLTNLAQNLEILPLLTFEYTPIGSGVFGAVTGIAIFRHQLFDIQPLARDQIVDDIDNPIVVVDESLRLIDYNAAATRLFPALAGAVGTSIGELVPPLLADGHDEEGDVFVERFRRFDDGTRRSYSVSVTRLETGGTHRGYALVIEDVTELQSYARQLEQQTEQLDRVAGTISHDLRSPLNVAAGALQLAAEDPEQIDRAQDALGRMEQIIDDALALAREGQAIGDRELVALADVVEAAWATSPTTDATLSVDLSDDLQVYADSGRLQTVFENLFRNSIEHASTDGSVEIRVGVLESSGEPTGFYVADDGPGIPEADRIDLFEAGYTTAEDGTGLGLAIVDSIVQAHGWRIDAEDAPTGGARFAVRGVDLVDASAVDQPAIAD
jgi:PAS domain S-box-containing protein